MIITLRDLDNALENSDEIQFFFLINKDLNNKSISANPSLNFEETKFFCSVFFLNRQLFSIQSFIIF